MAAKGDADGVTMALPSTKKMDNVTMGAALTPLMVQ